MEIVRDEIKEEKKSDKPKISPQLGKEEPTIPKPEYDPNKKYTWKPTDVFYLSGNEFGIVLNALRGVLSTKEAHTILVAERASDIIENTLARAVEASIAKEIPSDNKPQ